MLRSFLLTLSVLPLCAPCLASIPGRAFSGAVPARDVVVWLDINSPAPRKLPHALMDQRNLTFIPHVLAIRAGTTVDFPNHDRVFHNVFSYHDGKRFDLGLYPVGTTRTRTFDQPGLSTLFCNIHPNMGAYIMVLTTPCFAVSKPDGRFELPQVPPGHYTYHAWRPGAAQITGPVDIQPGQLLEVRWPR